MKNREEPSDRKTSRWLDNEGRVEDTHRRNNGQHKRGGSLGLARRIAPDLGSCRETPVAALIGRAD